MKKITVILGLAVIFLALGAYKVFGQSSVRITTACESSNGALFAFNDNFSTLTSCSKRQRVVLLGEAPGTGGTPGAGNIAFIYGNYVLTRDGKIWHRDSLDTAWLNDSSPSSVPIETSRIVSWTITQFLDTDGNFWVWSFPNGVSTWTDLGHPITEVQ